MSLAVIWRSVEWRHHLSTPGNHRALCGADVLNAYEIDRPRKDECCLLCRIHAESFAIAVPQMRATPARDSRTIAMSFDR